MSAQQDHLRAAISDAMRARSRLNVLELLTPTNYGEERQRWLDEGKRPFNPQFHYDKDAIKQAIQDVDVLVGFREFLISGRYYYWFDTPGYDELGELAYHSLLCRLTELENLKIFLAALGRSGDIDDCIIPFERIYGKIEPGDIELARAMVEAGPEQAFRDHLLPKQDRNSVYYVEKCNDFLDQYLNGFRGMFSEDERAKLKNLEFNAKEIADFFRRVRNYTREHAHYGNQMIELEKQDPAYGIKVSPKYTAISVNAFSSSGKSVIGIPAERKVNGLKLIELVGHEINSHYRSAMATRSYFHDLLRQREYKDLLAPLIPMMAHSLNETLSEGLAKFSDVRVSGSAGLPKPYQILAIDFVRNGHNFQETMEYVYDLTRQNRKTEQTALNNAWNYTYRIFRGQRDTSSKCGYAFPKDKVYLCGFTTIVRNVVHWGDTERHSEPFMRLLRYSTLTLEELNILDCKQYTVDRSIASDPYVIWNYVISSSKNHISPDPVEWAANLLLNTN